jgi:hypothetical protein
MNQTICDAIRNRRVLQFTYADHPPIVEPHAYGLKKRTLKEVLRCYQTGGTSRSGKVPGWTLMEVDKIEFLIMTNEHFEGMRPKYSKGDKDMSTIFCEL